jgi:hypothetical protein
MHCVAVKFCLLTDERKVNRVTVSQELFDRSNADKNFLKNVITGDETWVYGYDNENLKHCSGWENRRCDQEKHVNQM